VKTGRQGHRLASYSTVANLEMYESRYALIIAPIISIGRLSAVLPIIGIGRL